MLDRNVAVHFRRLHGGSLVKYTYWAINPESGDTGGLYNHAFTKTNESSWGVWKGFDTDKV